MDSGQNFNLQKSFTYSGSISDTNLNSILNNTGFNRDYLPFTYLGVHIFKGKVKSSSFASFTDKILNKIAAWKGSLCPWQEG